jgi:hypothetical protein
MRYAQFIAVEREQLAPENSFIVAIRQAMTNLISRRDSMQPCVLGGVTDVYNLESTIFF